jgi:hypothetical protein
MSLNFDLLGDPIPENHGGRGRPPHIPTQENRSQVRVLLGLSWMPVAIARSLRITLPTLRKHYFSELKDREMARFQLKAAQIMMTYRAADANNAGAIKQLGEHIRQAELGALQADVEKRQKPKKPAKLGKKEQQQQAAEEVGGLYATPPAPGTRVN